MEKTKDLLRNIVPKELLDLYHKEAIEYQIKFGELLKTPFSLYNTNLLLQIKP
jgi:hypothetical protein